jgi:tetratricopeptide (TPR) repeat protein
MSSQNRRANLIFGSLVAVLAGTVVLSMYLNRDLPVIREASRQDFAGGNLPDNHPPIDGSNRVAALEQLSRENPQNADYKLQIGNAYYDMGQYEKAIAAYQETLRLKPDDPSVETDLATCYHYLGQHDRALELLNGVLEDHPGFPQALFNKGVILQSGKNDPSGAIAAWEALLRAEPNFRQKADLERRIAELKSTLR